ncbi:uncharacterized protein BXZ73DRAFT_98992 [Epithele typhae]|uniref:uncharacterized protein n=1 Tax=Epithele typhae TaxID=378194 RepID=UPI0020077EDB|nr:uncharacterized protein BXZ73DRAFT_98992 [Epithele typhae]KAH9940001.1 hypothetical protein BXZ73DRAFT_98992 [Epithele typhae]
MSAAVASAAVAFATAVHPNQDFALSAATSAARPSAATAAVCPSAAVAAFAVVAARSAAAVGPMHSAAASGAVVEHASAAVEADVLPSRSANSRQRMDRIVQNAQFLFDLWTFLAPNMPQRLYELVLSRSKHARLDIPFDWESEWLFGHVPLSPDLTPLILPEEDVPKTGDDDGELVDEWIVPITFLVGSC